MVLAAMQTGGGALYEYDGKYYTHYPLDIEKYLRLCNKLIFLCDPVRITEPQKLNNLKLVDYPNLEVRKVDNRQIRNMFFLTKKTREVVKKTIQDADVLVPKVPVLSFYPWMLIRILKSNKCHVFEVVGCAWDSMWYHDIKTKFLAPLFYLINRFMIGRAQNVVYVTSHFLQKRYPNNKHTIGCSNVVLAPVDQSVLEDRLNRIRKKDYKTITIGTGGAVNVRYKGQEYVIRAIAKLKEENLLIYYKMAGGGDNSYLLNLAKELGVSEQVEFLGLVPRDKMKDFYDSLDLYIHPSMQEGLPRVLIEAESRGLPALGARSAGIPELIEEDSLFNKKDANDIVRVMKTFTREKMLRTANQNCERAKLYTIDVLNDRRKAFYTEVMK